MKSALSIGNFDGVHLGHQSLIDSLKQFKAKSAQPVRTVVVTFDPHPIEVLKNQAVERLGSLKERIALLKDCGVDHVEVINFTKDLSQFSAEDFFNDLILTRLDPAFICVGSNFFFGRNREGSPSELQRLCAVASIECSVIEGQKVEGQLVSSSRIRKSLQEGNLVEAASLLGRNYSLSSKVVHGDKRGRSIGFPTANFLPSDPDFGHLCVPKAGVYATWAHFAGQKYQAVSNIGVKPTVSKKQVLTVETHLFSFDEDLYGKQLTVEFCDRLRDESKFASIDELIKQIHIDAAKSRARLTAL